MQYRPPATMLRVGVDTGGTFTDLVLLRDGRLLAHKVRSTPDDPSRAILAGLDELAGAAPAPFEVVHGSTVATNAVLERKGARVALLATAGFEDVLRIGRQTRRELYNFQVEAPRPLVESGLTFGIRERVTAEGEILVPLDEDDLERAAAALADARVDAVAVCLLHSYRNPAHEQLAADRLTRAGFAVSASHVVLPEYREFERWSTTVLDASLTTGVRATAVTASVGVPSTASSSRPFSSLTWTPSADPRAWTVYLGSTHRTGFGGPTTATPALPRKFVK